MRGSYKETSGNQYSAHLGCQDMLLDCAKRLKEQRNGLSNNKICKIADLGSADGSNSIRTIDIFLDALDSDCDNGNKTKDNSDLHVIFEEHPSSDEGRLTGTVSSWLNAKNRSDCRTAITCEVLMKSFYEPLFEANSIDFCMSYICLHWLDSSDNKSSDGIRGWKRLHLKPDDGITGKGLDDFVQVNERTAPKELKDLWKSELADPHLAHFLTLRARELKPGAELMVVMVSDPHEYWKPELSHESPLLKAMKKCIAEGSLRPEVLQRGIIPYYLRKPKDILDALALAQQHQLQNPGDPIHSLKIMDIRQYETLTGAIERSNVDGMKGARELFWAIHGGAVVNAGWASEKEVLAIQDRLVQFFDESYDPHTGVVKGNFIACVFRKQNHGPTVL
eukprot:CAMPEP_0116083058 /NCGR_PEP_ID=MMETSP0327-20121206/3066_1 /TAXON_ID=44447 /ORGANISM="Pseudo-nitzschia delicatissima, Strain B596" /LENGTH=391 /DNA_ID=CAMNT_0003573911 /DNA_START=266 /DNA_END=1441 /DNA_ORIENTATION=-